MSKCALVTGASRGIGKAIALALADAGYDIAINYAKSSDAADAVAEEIRNRGRKAETYPCDVADFAACQALVKAVEEDFGGIDLLVNNAGITQDGLLARMREEEFDRVIAVNLKSAFNLCRGVVPLMMRARAGAIVNIASVAGVVGNAGQVNYAASKAGVIGMTKALAKEVARRGITVNAVAPGFIETDMTAKLSEAFLEKAREAVPLGRVGKPEDVASAVVFLANAHYITGQTLVVDGGMCM